MTNLLTKYRDWQSDRKTRLLLKWSTQRQKGKSYYVAGYALFWGLGSTGMIIVLNLAFRDLQNIATIIIQFVIFLLGGFWLGHSNWNEREKEFMSNSEPPISRAEIAASK